jgi:hypothetical protein
MILELLFIVTVAVVAVIYLQYDDSLYQPRGHIRCIQTETPWDQRQNLAIELGTSLIY